MKITSHQALAAAAMLFFPVISQASLLTGTLVISGSVNISTVGGTNGRIDFLPVVTPGSGTAANPGSGAFVVNPAVVQKGDFVALANSIGTIENIESAFAPVNTNLTQFNFVTFSSLPNITFELTRVLGGVDPAAGCSPPPAAGQTCTPTATSPFNLQNLTTTSSTASFTVQGLELDTLTGTSTPITGTFAATFDSLNLQQLVALANTPAGVSTGFTATFTASAVPEPASILQLGAGALLLGFGALARRKRSNNA